jgi:hypothetical protein
MLEGVLINEAIEVVCEGTGHCWGATGARAIYQPVDPLVGKAIDPLAESRRRKGEGVRDGLQPLPFHDVAHGLGTAEDAGFFRLRYEGV